MQFPSIGEPGPRNPLLLCCCPSSSLSSVGMTEIQRCAPSSAGPSVIALSVGDPIVHRTLFWPFPVTPVSPKFGVSCSQLEKFKKGQTHRQRQPLACSWQIPGGPANLGQSLGPEVQSSELSDSCWDTYVCLCSLKYLCIIQPVASQTLNIIGEQSFRASAWGFSKTFQWGNSKQRNSQVSGLLLPSPKTQFLSKSCRPTETHGKQTVGLSSYRLGS